MIRAAFLSAAVLAAAACAPMTPRTDVAAAPPPGPCNAEGAGWAIGHAVDQALINRVLHDTGSREARVVKPGEAVTMEFNPERVTISVNERGAIDGIRCG